MDQSVIEVFVFSFTVFFWEQCDSYHHDITHSPVMDVTESSCRYDEYRVACN